MPAAAPKTFAANARRIYKQCVIQRKDVFKLLVPHLSLLITAELGEDSSYTLALGISNCTQLVAGIHPNKKSGNVRDDEAYAGTTDSPQPCPPRSMPLNLRAEQLSCWQGVS